MTAQRLPQERVSELDAEAVAASTQVDNMTDEVLGITVESLTPDKSKKLGYSADLKGVLVAGVKERSLAAQVGRGWRDVFSCSENNAAQPFWARRSIWLNCSGVKGVCSAVP